MTDANDSKEITVSNDSTPPIVAPSGLSEALVNSLHLLAPPPPPHLIQAQATKAPTSLDPQVSAALTSQVNVRQGEKRVSRARQTALALRNLHWPDVRPEELWLLSDGQRGGFAQVPRTLSMIMNMINDITKRKTQKAVPAGKTYLILWLHVYEEGLVRIDSEAEAAFEAGYGGQRNATTFRQHMTILKDLGFIDFRKGTKGPMQYVLLRNPYKVVQRLHSEKLVPDEHYAALIERANAIGSGQELGGQPHA